jgi:hypothetical protein
MLCLNWNWHESVHIYRQREYTQRDEVINFQDPTMKGRECPHLRYFRGICPDRQENHENPESG